MQTTPVKRETENVKVLYVLSHPIQYFSQLLKELSEVIDMEVCYYSDISIKGGMDKDFGQKIAWDIPLLEGYKYFFLKNYRAGHVVNNKFLDVWNPGVWKVVQKSDAKVIIVNDWTYSSTWLLFLIARMKGKKVWVRADNPVSLEYQKSKKVLAIKKLVLKHILFKWFIDKCMYTGLQSREFYKFYGVPEKRLVFTPHAVNNEFFQAANIKDKSELQRIKSEKKIPVEKKIILFVGKYISRKRPFDLLQAFASLNSNDYYLVLAGEGLLRPDIEKWIAERKLQNVLLTGFVNQSELPLYYSMADVFVLCSDVETWGLAVNEAMNFAKPVIVSDSCGCSSDLVKHGQNGFVFKTGDTEQLTTCLKKLLEDDRFRENAGMRSLEIINGYSVGSIVSNIQTALHS